MHLVIRLLQSSFFDGIFCVYAGIYEDVHSVPLYHGDGVDIIFRFAGLWVAYHSVEKLGAPRADAVFDVGDFVLHGCSSFQVRPK